MFITHNSYFHRAKGSPKIKFLCLDFLNLGAYRSDFLIYQCKLPGALQAFVPPYLDTI